MNAITQKQIVSFMKMRHPDMWYHSRSNEWIAPGTGRGMTQEDAKTEAQAELDAAGEGTAIMPEWASK